MIVIDASATVELVLGLSAGAAVEARIASPGETLHAPHLLSAEVAQVIRRHEARNQIDAVRGALALTDAADLDVTYHDHVPLLPRVWELRGNLSAYDALYVALAEAIDAPLVTSDRRLAAASGHRATVEAVGQP